MKITKKIIGSIASLFILGLLILAPQNILAEKNCKNSYIRNVLPSANSKLDSFKYFTFELSKDTNQDSVEFYINGSKQKVSLIEKENGNGYLAIVKGSVNLNKPGLLLLEIATSGSNENKCGTNLFVGLEINHPVIYKKPSPDISVVIDDRAKNELSGLGETNLIREDEEIDSESEDENDTTLSDLNREEGQTASISSSIDSGEKSKFFMWLTIILIIIFIAVLLKKPKKKGDKFIDETNTKI